MSSLAFLEEQLEAEQLKIKLHERKRLAAFKAAALLVTKIESERERIRRERLNEERSAVAES